MFISEIYDQKGRAVMGFISSLVWLFLDLAGSYYYAASEIFDRVAVLLGEKG